MIERQEIYCHNCNQYVQFDLDLEIDGNHVLKCPVCGHEHCRVVKDGKITDDRWDSRNQTYSVSTTNITFTNTSTFNSYASTTINSTGYNGNLAMFLHSSLSNTTSNY